jgi:hypothetical protein
MKINRWALIMLAALLSPMASAFAADVALDYDFYKSRVEPIFMKHRPSHGRCYVCHAGSNNALRLEKLSPGQKAWSEEQSLNNFQRVKGLVVAGEPDKSKLLLHPLAPEAGGQPFHSGGRQFASKNDADWKILEQWVRGQNK